MDRVIAKSVYDKELSKKYYLFHMFRKSSSIYFVMFLGLVVVAFAIQNSLVKPINYTNIIITWTLAAFTILLTPMLMMGRVKNIIRQEVESRKESVEIIEVTKEKLTRRVDGVSEKIVFGWNHIEQVAETKDSFYLYINKDSAMVLIKRDIVEGNIDILRKLINNNLKKNRKGKIRYKKYFKEPVND